MKKISLFAVLLLSALPAFAVIQCSVQVNRVLVYADGMVNVFHSGRNDYTMICSLNGTHGGVSTTTCAMWTSMLQSIKKNNGNAYFYYPGEGSCSGIATYSGAPIPIYIGDM